MIAWKLLFLSLFAPAISTAAVSPIVGPHRSDVSISSLSLTDTSRLDPFANDGTPRRVMVSSFVPIPHCTRKSLAPYMPPATAAFENDKFAAYGLPNGSFSALQLTTCNETGGRQHYSSRTAPTSLVLFSGALGTSRTLYSSMLQSIAAAGYLVVSIDHPYDADIVEFPDGTTIKGANLDGDENLAMALATRVDDIAFVLRQMSNTSFARTILPNCGTQHVRLPLKTAIVGHSFGGAAAAAAMLADPAIRGGVNLDGTMFGPVVEKGLDQPFMLMGHENKTQDTDPSWKAVWPKLTGWKREFEVKRAAHYSFSDLPLVTEVLGLQQHLSPEVGQVLGTVAGSRMANLTVSYVTAFLNYILKGQHTKILCQSKSFPEVILLAE